MDLEVGEFIGTYKVSVRTGADRRLLEENSSQKVVGYLSVDVSHMYKKLMKNDQVMMAFVFFDIEGTPRGFVNGWQDVRSAIDMIEKMQVQRKFDKSSVRKMKLLLDL